MEDDNGIELSLGLSFGGKACKSRNKDGSSSSGSINIEGGGNKGNLMGDLNNFLTSSIPTQDSDNGPKRNDPADSVIHTPQENFFTNLGGKSVSAEDSSMDLHESTAPQFINYGGLWDSNGKTVQVVEEQKLDCHEIGRRLWPEASNKRKMLFEETNLQKKHEIEVQHVDARDKNPVTGVIDAVKTEDTAESEVEGSISRVVSHDEDGSKHDAIYGSSRTPKESHGFAISSVIDFQGQKSYRALPGNESKVKNLTFGGPFPLQPHMSASYSGKVDNATGASSVPGFHLPSMIQLMPTANSEGIGNQLVIPAIFQARGSSEALLDERKASELARGSGKQHSVEEVGACGSSQVADGMKESNMSNMIFKSKEASQQTVIQGFSPEGSAIRPGIAAGLKFGGCGSYPDLPWVCTTGPGPNGRTISGVTYKYEKNQIKIICACHGSHMSPEEFVQHASAEQPNPETNTGLTSFSSSNPETSARS